ncbi:MAG: HD domain-containing phosphohydrolase [Patescibacteria group bacterium]
MKEDTMAEKILTPFKKIVHFVEKRKIPSTNKSTYTVSPEKIIELCEMIADETGFPEKDSLKIAAEFCDIGEISINEGILQKKEPLSESEWDIIKNHPKESVAIIENVLDYFFADKKRIKNFILYHHPWYENKGYLPEKMDELSSFGCRILAACLAYSAMKSPRYYRGKLNYPEIIKSLENEMVDRFDPEIITLIIKITRGES